MQSRCLSTTNHPANPPSPRPARPQAAMGKLGQRHDVEQGVVGVRR